MATLVGIIQGIIAGISILAVSVGVLYATSFGGGGVRFIVDGTVVEISASQRPATATAERLETEEPTPEATRADVVEVPQAATSAVVNEEPPSQPDPAPISPAVLAGYYDRVVPDLSAIIVSLGRLSSLLTNARPQEEGWRSDVTQLIEIVRGGHTHLALIEPSADLTGTHAHLLSVTGLCLGVADSLSGDVTQIPSDLFPLIGQALQRCTSEAKTMAESLN